MGFPARTPSCQHIQRLTVNETVNTQAPPLNDSYWSFNSGLQSYWSNLQSVTEMTRQLIKGTVVNSLT